MRQHDAGNDAGHKELADRFLGHNGIEDEPYARRDQDAQGAPGSQGAGGQGHVVILLLHLRDGDRPQGDCRGQAVTADRCKAGATCHRGHGNAAPHAAEPLAGRLKEIPADPGVKGQLAHEDEHGHHREHVVGPGVIRPDPQHGQGRGEGLVEHDHA